MELKKMYHLGFLNNNCLLIAPLMELKMLSLSYPQPLTDSFNRTAYGIEKQDNDG